MNPKSVKVVEEGAATELVALNVRNIERQLRDDFKVLCIHNHIPMQDAVVQLIDNAVKMSRL